MPWHNHILGNEGFSYNNFVDGNQWTDFTFGGVLGTKLDCVGVYLQKASI